MYHLQLLEDAQRKNNNGEKKKMECFPIVSQLYMRREDGTGLLQVDELLWCCCSCLKSKCLL